MEASWGGVSWIYLKFQTYKSTQPTQRGAVTLAFPTALLIPEVVRRQVWVRYFWRAGLRGHLSFKSDRKHLPTSPTRFTVYPTIVSFHQPREGAWLKLQLMNL
jgi:hypothetical protein